MKFFKFKIISLITLTMLVIGSFTISSCTDDFDEINTNPNNPEVVPTNLIFNGATRYLMNYTRDGWWSARMSLPWMQYTAQHRYVNEDLYQYRETQTTNGWFYLYKSANDFKSIIDLCENPDTSSGMEAYGNLNNQIAVSRIMLAYIFDNLLTHFGDVPYWSYGSDDPDFQALDIENFLQPVFAKQEKVYPDILKELKEAANQLNTNESVFNSGDNIYGGDAKKWKKFANSLRLRIANRIKDVYPGAAAEISDAIAQGVFESNADNAVQSFGTTSLEASPFWKTFMVDNRQDFGIASTIVNLLKGDTGGFGLDPRLPIMSSPIGFSALQVEAKAYNEPSYSDIIADPSLLDNYIGMPYGMSVSRAAEGNNPSLTASSWPSFHVIKPDFGEVLMEYAEVEFILSEVNGWDQSHYEKGIRSSMEKWGVSQNDINTYMSSVPPASKKNVITQKYIALYMQGDEAWNDYRRTGYPDGSILLLPGSSYVDLNGDPYVFTPMISGNVVATDLPNRVRYPETAQTLNLESYQAAVANLSNGDEINSKLWWDVN